MSDIQAHRPRLLRSHLTGTVYVVTRYKVTVDEKGQERFTAIKKHDVTEDFKRLVSEMSG